MLLERFRGATKSDRPAPSVSEPARRIAQALVYELVPIKSLESQLEHLPPGARVSVTCSPAKGLDATLDLAARLQGAGLLPTPHLAARLVRNRAHVGEIAARLREFGCAEAFIVAGDQAHPTGEYAGAAAFIAHLLEEQHGLARMGVTGYPDGHPLIDPAVQDSALMEKARLLRSAGIDGWISTQMCFDAARIATWIRRQRAAGITLDVRLGLPGPIDRTKLLTMGMRVGVGQSLRYLRKNRSGLTQIATGYDPSELLDALQSQLDDLGVTGMHLFTFNQLEAAVAWRNSLL